MIKEIKHAKEECDCIRLKMDLVEELLDEVASTPDYTKEKLDAICEATMLVENIETKLYRHLLSLLKIFYVPEHQKQKKKEKNNNRPLVQIGMWWLYGAELEVIGAKEEGAYNRAMNSYKVILIPKTQEGLDILTRMRSNKKESIDREQISTLKDRMLIGSPAYGGEVGSIIRENKPMEKIAETLEFSDFVMIYQQYYKDMLPERIKEENKKISGICKEHGLPVVFSKKPNMKSDVNDCQSGNICAILRRLNYLGTKTAEEVVVINPTAIKGMVDIDPLEDSMYVAEEITNVFS